ncbi:MAG: hypothetical protein NTV86_16445 [Planctomycetota bacterium]|nr:hypothetical protein [Planctomycetota bacterium]
MRLTLLAAFGSLMFAGCGGQFSLYAPDPVAPAGQEAAMVVRLQRADLFNVPMAVKETCVRFQVGGVEQAAYTDKEGFAAVALRAPIRPGNYPLRVAVQAKEGEEITRLGRFYVWARERTAVAVDMDSLPTLGSVQASGARSSLVRLATRANIVYLSQKPVSEHDLARRRLEQCGYPDGPIVPWENHRWEMVTRNGIRMPQIHWEGKMISQLPLLRERFPGLNAGVSTNPQAAAAFHEAKLRPVVVGGAYVPGNYHIRCNTWADLPAVGL